MMRTSLLLTFLAGCIFLMLPQAALAQDTFRDDFSSASYSNNDGTLNFSSNWNEENETDNPSSGKILITGGDLRFDNLDNVWIHRSLNLSGATSVTLTIGYDATSRGNESLYVYLWDGSGYQVVDNINSSVTGTVTYNLAAAYIRSDASIAFGTSSGNWGSGERIDLSYVQFSASFSPFISIDDVTVDESAGTATFTATHSGASASGAFTVNFTTTDGTATAGSDYTATSGTLSFNGTTGDTETITVPITEDSIYDGDETFTVSFTSVSDGSVVITDTATGTITDNEVVLDDVPLSLYRNMNGNYDYSTAGGTFRTAHNNTDPCAVTTTSSATLTSAIPAGAQVAVAYLFWSHSSYSLDSQVTFEGQNVDASLVYSAGFTGRQFYGYLADVTDIVSGISNPTANTFDLTDLTIDSSSNYCSTATVLGAWSLMVFYEDSSLTASTINLYYGFDITQNAGTSFTLDSFYAISAAGSKATFLSYEGDDTLDGSSGGSTNPEELSITNQLGFNFVLSGDGGQTGNNAYNSTVYDGPAGVNNSNIYGLDLDTYDIASYIVPTNTQVTANVDVGQDLVISSAVVIRVPSNLISGTVFEDINYPGGAGRNQSTAAGIGVENATVELYTALGVLQRTTTTDSNGDYSFGGMADGSYFVRVVNQTVRSSRGGGSGCSNCYAVQTFRTSYNGSSLSSVTDEVGGADPSATADAAAGTTVNAQTISSVVIAGGGIGNIDFGFNFNTIVNTNEDGQGSLEQFIVNANNLDEAGLDIEANSIFDPGAGEDVTIFMIPPSGDPLGRTADSGYSGGYFDISISNGVNPTDISSDNLHIDGRTQTAYSGDTNSGTIGSGGSTVGVGATGLPNYELPEVLIHRNNGDLFVNTGSNNVIRNLAIYATNNAGIRMDGGSLTVRNNLLAVDATGANAGNIDSGVEVNGGNGTITENYIATATDQGIWVRNTSSLLVSLNHITGNGTGNCGDNILAAGGSGITITQNLVENSEAVGINLDGSAGGVTISENTVTASGQDTACFSGTGGVGIRLDGSNNSVSANIVFSNGNAGIAVIDASGSGNTISQNSIYANGTTAAALGIDLHGSGGGNPMGDGVTINDPSDADSGPNGLENFPMILAAYISGSELVVKGWSQPGATLEIFFTDINEGTATVGDNQLGNTFDYGEGQVYIATYDEGSLDDLDAASSAYSDADGNTDTTNQFEFHIPLPSGTIFGDWITATATRSGSTSEFGPMTQIKVRTVITNRRITYRVNPN